jgi:hypothetical protein
VSAAVKVPGLCALATGAASGGAGAAPDIGPVTRHASRGGEKLFLGRKSINIILDWRLL